MCRRVMVAICVSRLLRERSTSSWLQTSHSADRASAVQQFRQQGTEEGELQTGNAGCWIGLSAVPPQPRGKGGGGGCLKGAGECVGVGHFTLSSIISRYSQGVESYINISKCEQKEAFSAAWSLANQKPQCKIVEDQ